MTKLLNSDFKPKIVPVIDGLKAELLKDLQFPICLQPIPEIGIPVVIRPGTMQLFTKDPIKNLNLKAKLEALRKECLRLKVTLEGIITCNAVPNERFIMAKLMSYTENVDDLQLHVTDMVFENCPQGIKYLVRARDMKVLFREDKIGGFPKIVDSVVINSLRDFEDNILAYSVLGTKKFRIASPNSVYKFGEIDDLFNGDGGVVDLDSESLFKGTLLSMVPKVLKIKNKPVYLAATLVVKYNGELVEIPLESISTVLATKFWENRKGLINKIVMFSGLLLPGYTYPKFRSFIRFEK
jgi:hypothetical protein